MRRETDDRREPAPWTLRDDEAAVLATCARPVRLAPGEVLFARDDPGATMYAVTSGTVELVFDPGKDPKVLGPGCYFGELALIRGDHRRSATVRAVEGCELLELDQEAFASLLVASPQVLYELLRRSCISLLESERALIDGLRAKNAALERTLDFLRRTREELDSQALLAQTDELTGLYNRRCFNDRLTRLVERAGAHEGDVALLLIDIDRFKQVNDRHGHPAGDRVLKAVAHALRTAVRWSDLPCRIGGDEFAVILGDLPGRDAARERTAEVFRRLGALTVEVRGETVLVGVSGGAALLRSGESAEKLVARADASLYLAKGDGRGRLAWQGRLLAGRRQR